MRTVRIIEGIYGYRNKNGMVRPKHIGETVELTDEEAERIVHLNVAEFVTSEPVATAPVTNEDKGQCDNTGDNENASQEDEEAVCHLDPEQLKELKMDELRKMAEEMGVETHGLNTKAKLIDAICSEPVTPGDDDDETPPEIGAGAPV